MSIRLALASLAVLASGPVGAQARGVDPYDRPGTAVTVDLGGTYAFGGGVAVETRVLDGLAVRGSLGRRGGLSGPHPGVSVGAMALGVGGWRWAELEAGLGAAAEVGGSESRLLPTAHAGLRFSLPMGRGLDGGTVPRDLLLRIGGSTVLVGEGGARDLVGFPSLSAGVAF